MKRRLINIGLVFLVAVLALGVAFPVYAQIREPDGIFTINQIEAYRNCLELNDQLYLITGTVEYATSPTNYTVDEAYIVRLMNGAAELGSTTFYPYYDSGYDVGVCAIYFDSASAPAWNGAYSVDIDGNPTLHWLDSAATAATAMDGAIADDGGVYTDETAASNSAAANDMTLMPAAPADDDAYYFGSSGMFDHITLNVGTNGNWTGTYTWEYWDGDEWKAVTGLSDGTTGFTAGTGNREVSYDCPEDWQQTTVNGTTLYWLRFRVVTFTAIVVQPLGTQSWTNTLATPPTVSSSTFSLWYDGGTLLATRERLTTRIRALAANLENEWNPVTVDLIEDFAGEAKFTDEGETYFDNTIDNLRTICPDLYYDVVITPEFPDMEMVQDFYMSDDDGDRDAHGNNWFAQTFTPTANYSINGVYLKMLRVGAPGDLTVSIRATAAGLPAAGDVVSGTLSTTDFTTDADGDWYFVSFTADTALTSGTTYAIICRALAGNAANYVGWRSNSAGTYAGGQACSSINAGVAWAAIAAEDFMFSVTATDSYAMSYRNRLANQLVGTRFDMTSIAADLNMSRMWFSSALWFVGVFVICFAASLAARSYKIAMLVMIIMLPFGALLGFVYLELALLWAFAAFLVAIYVYFYRPAS